MEKIRIIQDCLVFVSGLPASLADPAVPTNSYSFSKPTITSAAMAKSSRSLSIRHPVIAKQPWPRPTLPTALNLKHRWL